MIRVVLDTNIIISGSLWRGTPSDVLQTIYRDDVQAIVSEDMLDELKDVLHRKKFQKPLARATKTPDETIAEYLSACEIVEPAIINPVIEDDPDDDVVLACAVGGAADYIVSGDPHLLQLKSYQRISLVDVHKFLALLSET
ncbi:MAG: putative toxin-antitoxin system toxin component, PIN family [Aggregatilineales bacterium]